MTEPWPEQPARPPEPEEASDPPKTSFPRRHRTGVIAAGIVVVAVGAGTGIALAASGSSTSVAGQGTPAAAPSASPAPSPSGSRPTAGHARKATRATIVSESGSTWTVRTRDGRDLTVTITATTKFGTKKSPATRAAFTPGVPVLVVGEQANGAITATRVAAPVGQSTPARPSSAPVPPSAAATA